MTELTLKPLPEPAGMTHGDPDAFGYATFVQAYTLAQVEQIRRDAVRAALGAAAEACEAQYVSLSQVATRPDLIYNTAIDDACDAIRALMPKEEGK